MGYDRTRGHKNTPCCSSSNNIVPYKCKPFNFIINWVMWLTYYIPLRSYVVINLKNGNFKPKHLGQLNFYQNLINNSYGESMTIPL